MILAITGGRYHPQTGEVLIPPPVQVFALFFLIQALGVSVIVNGRAKGTDQYISQRVRETFNGSSPDRPYVRVDDYPVLTSIDGPWPRAGHNRNRRMLEDSRADALSAFPGGGGTADCVSIGMAMGLLAFEWQGDDGGGAGDFILL